VAKQAVQVSMFYDGVFNDVTADVLVKPPISITRGRADETQQPAPSTATLRFKGWKYSPDNPTSELFGKIGRNTVIKVAMVAAPIRFTGEIASYTLRQTLGGPDNPPFRWVEVVATGVTRRLGQGADPLESAPARFARLGGAVGYWPLGDLPGATQAASGLSGGDPLRPKLVSLVGSPVAPDAPLEWGQGPSFPHLPPGMRTPDFAAHGESVELHGTAAQGAGGGLAVDVLWRSEAPAGTDPADTVPQSVAFRVVDQDGLRWILLRNTTATTWQVLVQDADGGSIDSFTTSASPALHDGQVHHLRLQVDDAAGTTADVTVYVDGVSIGSDTFTGVSSTLAAPGPVRLSFGRIDGPPDLSLPVQLGHLVVWDGGYPSVADMLDAYRGHPGEPAAERIDRVLLEEGISFSVSAGTAADTIPLGPQYPDGLMAIIREAADADDGVVTDHRQVSGTVTYFTGRSRYNQDPALEVDYAQDEVAQPLEPAIDDQATRNDVTVTRRDGVSVQAVDQDGPLGIDAIGRVTTSVQVNVMGDGMVGDQAGWRLLLGTVGGTRYPRLTVDLVASPGLVSEVNQIELGDLITVANLPAELSPDLARLLVLGWTEVIGSHSRKITFNTVPAKPYQIGEVEHDDYSHVGPDPAWGFTTSASFTSGTSTSMGVAFSGNQPGFLGADVPFDILVAGVRLHVTATSGASSPNVLTVDQAPVNGVVKVIPAGTQVGLFHPAYIGL
jgi:hypothetical protein